MSRLFRLAGFALLPLAIALFAAGCHNNAASVQADNNQADTQNPASDPATANLAPVPDNSGTISYQQSAPPDQSSYDPSYGEQPEYTSAQPPPPLPDYDQPQCPGDDYIWTPGYWAWSPDGYYWVPGAWIEAPYEGALWTPGYWGFWDNVYGFYPGYWGQYIGYYGGINYGFGYVGFGYQGGYWGGGHFYYNRSVNNVNISVVHNVYSRSVAGNTNDSRVSYNGGSGGVRARARPAELAAMRQPHTAPMTSQVQNQRTASTNRAQFAKYKSWPPGQCDCQPASRGRSQRESASGVAENQSGCRATTTASGGSATTATSGGAPTATPGSSARTPGGSAAAPGGTGTTSGSSTAAPNSPATGTAGGSATAASSGTATAAASDSSATATSSGTTTAASSSSAAASSGATTATSGSSAAAPGGSATTAAPQQHQAAPQQHQAAPQPQHQAAPKQDEQHPK